MRLAHGEFAELAKILPRDGHRERLRLEAHPVTVGTFGHNHILFELGANRIAGRFVVPALHIGEDSFPPPFDCRFTFLFGMAVQQRLLHSRRKFSPGHVQFELELLRQAWQNHAAQIAVGLTPWEHDTFENRDAGIAQHQLGDGRAPRAKSAAGRARAKGRVEREVTRLELGQGDAAVRAAVFFTEELALAFIAAGIADNFDEPVGETQSRLE